MAVFLKAHCLAALGVIVAFLCTFSVSAVSYDPDPSAITETGTAIPTCNHTNYYDNFPPNRIVKCKVNLHYTAVFFNGGPYPACAALGYTFNPGLPWQFAFPTNNGVCTGNLAWFVKPITCDYGGNYNSDTGMCDNAPACPPNQFPDALGRCSSVDPLRNTGAVCPSCGNPINPAIGNKFQRESDYVGQGVFPLQFSRFYNSESSQATTSFSAPVSIVRIGFFWRHRYEQFIRFDGSTATVYRNDGRAFKFKSIGSLWVPQDDVSDKLLKISSPSGWQYKTADGELVENYDINGKLTFIVNREGLMHTLGYDAQSRLSSVTDSFNRQLTFTYDASNRIATMTDPQGGLYQYNYDVNHNLTSVTRPGTPARIYHYNEPANTAGANLVNALTGITDENGVRFATYQYDTSGRATSTAHAGGVEQVTISYGTNSATVTDALGTQRTFNFGINLGVAKNSNIAQPAASGTGSVSDSKVYDKNGNVSSRVDFNGNRTCYAYDLGRNLETTRVEGLGNAACPVPLSSWKPQANTPQRRITTQWHDNFRLPKVIAEPLRKTTYVYNGDGGANCSGATLVPGVLCSKTVQATTDATGVNGVDPTVTGTPRVWSYTYNPNGSVLTMTGPAVQTAGGPVTPVTTHTYHANNATCATTAPGSSAIGCRGQIASVSNHLNQTTQIPDYNAHGQPLTVIDPNGLTTTLTYDARMRLTSRNVGGETTGYTYDNAGQLTRVTLPDASALEYQYDPAHRLTEIRLKDNTNTLIGKTTYTLDLIGNRTAEQIKNPADVVLQARSRVYNNLNRLIQDIGGTTPASQITTYGYDNQGNLQSVSAPSGAGGTRNYTYDALNRLATQIDPTTPNNPASGGGTTLYAYNGLDQLTQVTDPRSLITSYSYDGLNNLNQQTSPDTGTTTHTSFDAAGNLLTSIDAKNQQTTYTYDALGRVTGITYPQATGNQLKSVTYNYDSVAGGNYGVGRLTQVIEADAATPTANTLQVTDYRYDQKGRLTQETRTINTVAYVTGYGYDAAGRMDSITYPSGRQVNYTFDSVGRIKDIITTKDSTTRTVVQNTAYRPFGPVSGFTFGNGQTYSRGYDQDGRISSYSQATQTIPLCYDLAGRIVALGGAVSTCIGGSAYAYDDIDRLTSAVVTGSNQSFGYDKVGNRVSQTVGTGNTTYTYNFSPGSNRLQAVAGLMNRAYVYDANGSVTGEGTNTFTYDARGRMTQVVGTLGTSAYQVSSQGQRIRKSGAGGDTVYHYDAQGRLISESTATGAMLKEYVFLGDIPVAIFQ